MPNSLSRSFTHARQYPVMLNKYQNGELQVGSLGATSGKRWQIGKRLKAADLLALRAFYDARQGGLQPFYFYDPFATTSVVYDATGVATRGRFMVRFDGTWDQSMGLGRGEVGITLVEVV